MNGISCDRNEREFHEQFYALSFFFNFYAHFSDLEKKDSERFLQQKKWNNRAKEGQRRKIEKVKEIVLQEEEKKKAE